MQGLLITLACVASLVAGVPIAFVILLAVVLLVATDPFVNLSAIPSLLVQGMDSFILLSIPLFVLVGVIMNSGGITQRLLDLAVVLVGKPRSVRMNWSSWKGLRLSSDCSMESARSAS